MSDCTAYAIHDKAKQSSHIKWEVESDRFQEDLLGFQADVRVLCLLVDNWIVSFTLNTIFAVGILLMWLKKVN
jgi:hypothetical protein